MPYSGIFLQSWHRHEEGERLRVTGTHGTPGLSKAARTFWHEFGIRARGGVCFFFVFFYVFFCFFFVSCFLFLVFLFLAADFVYRRLL